jgi:hypothetical protein
LAGLPEPIVTSIKQLVDSLREGIVKQRHSGLTGEPLPLRGRFTGLKLAVPSEDLDRAQKEAWHNFPRDFPQPGQS